VSGHVEDSDTCSVPAFSVCKPLHRAVKLFFYKNTLSSGLTTLLRGKMVCVT
jgi:hypothetical protein